jgi:hypothetical protein
VYNYVRIDGCAAGNFGTIPLSSRHHVLQDGDLPQSSTRLQLSIIALFSVLCLVHCLPFIFFALLIFCFHYLFNPRIPSLLAIPLPRQHDYPFRYLIRNDRLLIDRLDALVLVAKSPTVIYTAIHNGNPGNIAADISNLAQTPPAGMGPPMRTILLRCGNIFSSGICVQFDDVGGLR